MRCRFVLILNFLGAEVSFSMVPNCLVSIEEKVTKKINLRTYRLFKQNFNFEPYLNILDFKQRQALTKLRIGNHLLEIELGRHKNIKAADRICKIYKDGVEDELTSSLNVKTLKILENLI
jgi:hypothetical protein